jgi:translation initiation factor 1 (eIF-1/SUI1)
MSVTVRLIERTPTVLLTSIEGIDKVHFNMELLRSVLTYECKCSGVLYTDQNTGNQNIKLKGNHMDKVKSLLIYYEITDKDNINIIDNRF